MIGFYKASDLPNSAILARHDLQKNIVALVIKIEYRALELGSGLEWS